MQPGSVALGDTRLVGALQVGTDVLAGAVELLRERVRQGTAPVSQRVGEERSQGGECLPRASGSELAEQAMAEKPELRAAVRVDAAGNAGHREGAIELRAAGQQHAQGLQAVDSVRCELFEQGSQTGDLLVVEAARGEPLPESPRPRAQPAEHAGPWRREESVERRDEARIIGGALDHNGPEGVAYDGTAGEPDRT